MILALNTSTLQFSIALVNLEGTLGAETVMPGGKGHYGRLMPALRDLLDVCETGFRDVAAVAVATGPGSFTGLRVGLSAAKGLVHALGVPLMGIPSLHALASQVVHSDLPVCALLDSRREEYFCATYSRREGRLDQIKDTDALGPHGFDQTFPAATLFIGNDFAGQGAMLTGILGTRAVLAPAQAWCLRASSVGILGLERLNSGRVDDPGSLDPIYLRAPDIRPNPYPLKAK